MPDAIPLLYNPAAGGGRGLFKRREAEAVLDLHGIHTESMPTKHPGHAGPLVAELAEAGHDTVLVVGGDGTVSDAAQGAVGKPVRLGVLPGGTGNDFLRHFGVTSMGDAARRIADGAVREVDAVRVTWTEDGEARERYSINLVATGFAARVADRTNRQYKFLGGAGYSAAVVRELAGLRSDPTELLLDGEAHDGTYALVALCNTAYTGGGMKMAPGADAHDGRIDWLVLDKVGRARLMGLFGRIFKGTHVGQRPVHVGRARSARVAPDRPSPLLIDGEVLGTTPMEAEVVPGAVRMLL